MLPVTTRPRIKSGATDTDIVRLGINGWMQEARSECSPPANSDTA